MEALVSHFNWTDPRLYVLNGTREQGAIRVSGGGGGGAIYGPYIAISPGAYTAIFKFLGPCCGTAVMDVCINAGTQILARRIVEAEQVLESGRAELQFSVAQAVVGLEVRLYNFSETFIGAVEYLQIVDGTPWSWELSRLVGEIHASSRNPIDRALAVLARKLAPLVGETLTPRMEELARAVTADVNQRINKLRIDLTGC